MRYFSLILFCCVLMGCSHKVLKQPAATAAHAAPEAPAAPAVQEALADTVKDAKLKVLDSKLDQYLDAMKFITPEEKYQECDFLISSASDSLVRNHIAVYLYSKFISSNLMGDEAVAIYLTDNWFVPGKVSFRDYSELASARVYADFNRQSLIGKKASSLLAYPPMDDAKPEEVLPADGRYKVLFIFNTSCSTCKAESVLLEEYFNGYKGVPFDFIAFYAGSDADAWQKWREKHFAALAEGNGIIEVKDFWDPEIESDFQRKFGVLATPCMFLIDGDGTILGRRLDPPGLKKMLEIINAGN